MALTAQHWTISAIAVELKIDKRIIAQIVDEHEIKPSKVTGNKRKLNHYRMADVVTGMLSGERLDLTQERAKLAKKQQEKTALQVEEMKGGLVPAEQVGGVWKNMVANCRAKLLSLPVKAASALIGIDSLPEIQKILKQYINEALAELAVTED